MKGPPCRRARRIGSPQTPLHQAGLIPMHRRPRKLGQHCCLTDHAKFCHGYKKLATPYFETFNHFLACCGHCMTRTNRQTLFLE